MWIYLKCEDSTSSAVLPALPWHCETTCNQYATAKSTPIAKASCCKECRKGICPKHQFGMIYEPLKPLTPQLESLIRDVNMDRFLMWTSSTAASRDHAKISVLQEMEKDWQESEADFFSRSCAWPKKSNPYSYSLKTYQLLQPEGDFKSLVKLPRWGMIVDGVLYPLRPLERYINVNDGSCWPTPSARDWKDSGNELAAQARKSPCLPAAVMMATPTASQAGKPIRAVSPSASKQGRMDRNLEESIGHLNPELIGKKLSVPFVESMMAYPIGWSALNVLEIQ